MRETPNLRRSGRTSAFKNYLCRLTVELGIFFIEVVLINRDETADLYVILYHLRVYANNKGYGLHNVAQTPWFTVR